MNPETHPGFLVDGALQIQGDGKEIQRKGIPMVELNHPLLDEARRLGYIVSMVGGDAEMQKFVVSTGRGSWHYQLQVTLIRVRTVAFAGATDFSQGHRLRKLVTFEQVSQWLLKYRFALPIGRQG